MKLTSDQRKTIQERFRQIFPSDDIFVRDSPSGVRVETPRYLIAEIAHHHGTYQALLAVADVMLPLQALAPEDLDLNLRSIIAIASQVQEELQLLKQKNDKLLEMAMAGWELTRKK